ncbi:hypothetical protein C1752_06326 [Acaryochloris thomasi RCC1774]|uniref:VOC domain-containing protein n=1 Tax=Acaryochloris thomasi RCC1774 TaxID=1764569 RepID=A0A2W1JBQ5_9CYAN|nr:hypothetical protein [Acaryochloris thomasi]PZD71490.1 hypothetical protein C1752_06326 [Acaryochloris thomasi RCC1774]
MTATPYLIADDATFATGLTAGATSVSPPTDQFDGDRRGTLTDLSGHTWLIMTKRDHLITDELTRRFANMMTKDGG